MLVSRLQYRAEIDGLRAVAIVPVVLFHAGFEAFGGGFVGVDVFFVISGYLITSIILFKMNAGDFSLVGFYERRARRILPALIFVAAACVPAAWLMLTPRDLKDFAQSLVAVSTFSSNILFWHETDYFGRLAELKPLVHTWSLAVEEQYYILFPLLLIFAVKAGERFVLSVLAVLFVVSFGASQWAAYHSPSAAFFFLPTRAWELLLGVFAAFQLGRRDRIALPVQLRDAMGWLGLGLIAYAVAVFDVTTPVPSLYTLVPTIGTLLIILFVRRDCLTGRLLANRMLVGLGLISYSAYLWHQPLFAFARHYSLSEPSSLLMVSLAVATLPLAYMSWRFVEQPFRRKGHISRKRVVQSAVVGMSVVFGLGVAGHATHGFEDNYLARFDEDVRPIIRQFSTSHDYVDPIWKSIGTRDFTGARSKTKVLLIGDSFARDLTNAIYEAGLDDRYYLSVFGIDSDCAYVFALPAASSSARDGLHPSACAPLDIDGNQDLLTLMKQADEVWLSASWSTKVAQNLPASIKTIKSITNARLRIWGRKSFGTDVSLKAYIHALENGNGQLVAPLPNWHVSINNMMKGMLPGSLFVDVSGLLCGSETICRNTTPDGHLISFDGVHLTQQGALFFGKSIKAVLSAD